MLSVFCWTQAVADGNLSPTQVSVHIMFPSVGQGTWLVQQESDICLFLGEFVFIFCFPFVKMPFLYICVLRTNGNMLGQKGIQESKMER